MTDDESNVTLIWAHTPQRYIAFRNLGIAGIHFGVEQDLTGMSADEITENLAKQGLSRNIIGEFNRLIFGTPVGSFVVSSIPNFRDAQTRKWSVGQVVGGYKYQPRITHDRHTIQVQWWEQQFTIDQIVGLIGIDPSGRRPAVSPLNGAHEPKIDG